MNQKILKSSMRLKKTLIQRKIFRHPHTKTIVRYFSTDSENPQKKDPDFQEIEENFGKSQTSYESFSSYFLKAIKKIFNKIEHAKEDTNKLKQELLDSIENTKDEITRLKDKDGPIVELNSKLATLTQEYTNLNTNIGQTNQLVGSVKRQSIFAIIVAIITLILWFISESFSKKTKEDLEESFKKINKLEGAISDQKEKQQKISEHEEQFNKNLENNQKKVDTLYKTVKEITPKIEEQTKQFSEKSEAIIKEYQGVFKKNKEELKQESKNEIENIKKKSQEMLYQLRTNGIIPPEVVQNQEILLLNEEIQRLQVKLSNSSSTWRLMGWVGASRGCSHANKIQALYRLKEDLKNAALEKTSTTDIKVKSETVKLLKDAYWEGWNWDTLSPEPETIAFRDNVLAKFCFNEKNVFNPYEEKRMRTPTPN